MNTDNDNLLDDLALLVDGDPEALERHADALADSDDARDLLFEASRAAEAAAEAGADYMPPTDLEARLMAALDARTASTDEAGVAVSVAVTAEAASTDGAPTTPAANPDPTSPDAVAQPAASEAQQRRETSSTQSSSSKGSSSKSSSGGNVIKLFALAMGGLGVAAAAALAITVGMNLNEGGGDLVESMADGALTARIDRISRATDDTQSSGVVIIDGEGIERAAAAGETLASGATVRTDERTRLVLALSDGSELVLNRDTELTLEASAPRTVRLKQGELLADIAHLETAPHAFFDTPSGQVEVLGTKFVLSASEDSTSVRVTRGTVRAHGAGGAADVKTGEEGILRQGAAASVGPASNLAESVAWSELGHAVDDDVPIAGLGELRAHRPGEREEQERPLNLAHHKVTVRVVGNVARTEIEETFRNDSGDVLEGVYRFPMPPNARIASLSLEVDGRWEEGAFVPRERASKIWRGVIRNATPERRRQRQEEFIWVPGPWRDPALLEWQRGGRFELRIFPIPAHGERRVRLSYEQTIAPHGEGRRYTYPLAHAADESTRVGRFEVDVRVAGADERTEVKARGYEMSSAPDGNSTRLRYTAENFQPSGDLVIDYELPNGEAEMRYWTFRGQATAPPAADSREGDPDIVREQRALHEDTRPYVVFALRPEVPAWTTATSREYVLVVDSSQSMVGERYDRSVALVEGLVAEMDRRDRFRLLACDVGCEHMLDAAEVPSATSAAATREWLEKIRPAGASHVAGNLREAAQVSTGAGDRAVRVVYIGDGMGSIGHRRASSIAAEVAELTGDGRTFTTVGIGADADTVALASIARSGGGHYIPYVPGQRAASAALAVLETTYGASVEKPEVVLPAGLADAAPTRLPTIRNGQEVLVVARMTGDEISGEVELRGSVGGRPFSDRYPVTLTASTAAGNAFVPRMWASQTIESLEAAGRGEDTAKIVALSRGFGVMSRETSLLVLESEAMFRAFGVDRQRPTLQWTGEEDMEVGLSTGLDSLAASLAGGAGTLGHGGGRGRGYGTGSLGGLAGADVSGRSAAGETRRRARNARPARVRQPSRRAPRADEPMDDVAMEPGPSVTATAQPRGAEQEAARPATRRPPARPPGRRGGRWMRKVWFREGHIERRDAARERDVASVRAAETALAGSPDSRDKHRDLVRALSRAGDLGRAEEVVEAWIERDRLDPEALTYLADVVGRQGRRTEAVRLLSGIVDLSPDNVTLQRRLANAYDRAGKAERACAHRVALAEIRRSDAEVIAAAVQCERALGRSAAAERLLTMVREADTRAEVETIAGRPSSPERVRGDLLLDATWTGSSDVDLTLVTPQGTRLSWLGGRTNVVGDNAGRVGRERLGLRRAARGTYYIEVSRVDPEDASPVRGEIRVRALDGRRTLRFDLTGTRQMVGQVQVVRRWRMENR